MKTEATKTLSRNIKTLFAAALLAAFTLITTTINSAAQDTPVLRSRGVARMRWQEISRHGSLLSHSLQPPTSSPTWSLLIPGYSTSELFFETLLSEHSAVYDPGSNTMIVFGGLLQDDTLRNTVLLETNANGSAGMEAGTWSELNVNIFPPARMLHSAVYDQANNRMVVFGGCADLECDLPLNDTWVLANANGTGGAPTWTQLSPTGALPTPRYFHNAAYDATNNRMIVYSGQAAGYTSLSDVWVLTNANGLGGTPTWTQLTPTGGTPDAQDESAAVYDPVSNSLIAFGGGNFVNSVWTLSNANGLTGTPAWSNLIANGAKGAPRGRAGAQAVYDSASNRMTIFGGNGDFGPTTPDADVGTFNDVWVLTNAHGSGGTPAWTQIHPKFAGDGLMLPGTRDYFTAVRDPGTNSMIIFGGVSIEAAYGSPWVLSHANGL
jgi:hypothetical protein